MQRTPFDLKKPKYPVGYTQNPAKRRAALFA
jgi:hypothetical protein